MRSSGIQLPAEMRIQGGRQVVAHGQVEGALGGAGGAVGVVVVLVELGPGEEPGYSTVNEGSIAGWVCVGGRVAGRLSCAMMNAKGNTSQREAEQKEREERRAASAEAYR